MSKKQNISLSNSVVQGQGNILSDMDGEKVMLSIQNGKYYNLGEIGGKIWDLIIEPISITRLVNTLMAEYHVEQGQCEEHVMSFLENLLEEGLIVTV